MQNNYQGPPQDFAMVVPVPVILQEKDVKTLGKAVFDRVDQLAAPRLVEYWEQDPCPPPEPRRRHRRGTKDAPEKQRLMQELRNTGNFGVRIEAKFAVGEYQIRVRLDSIPGRPHVRAVLHGIAQELRGGPCIAARIRLNVPDGDAERVDGSAM